MSSILENTTHLQCQLGKDQNPAGGSPRIFEHRECFAACIITMRELKIRCPSRENLEFEGAKSSFQKGLGSKSRFLKISKILSFQGLKSSLDIKFQFLNSQRCSGNSKTSVLMITKKNIFLNFFITCKLDQKLN